MDHAITACLVSGQHCIVSPGAASTEHLGLKLQQLCVNRFSIEPSILTCTRETTVDNFNDCLTEASTSDNDIEDKDRTTTGFGQSKDEVSSDEDNGAAVAPADREIKEIVIAVDLDRAVADVQVQVIELLRTKRIFTRSSVQRAPKNFLLMAVMSSPEARLQRHLQDMFAVSYQIDQGGIISATSNRSAAMFKQLDRLRSTAASVILTAELDSYLHDVVLFMRNSRYVQGGATAGATRHFRLISKALAAMESIDFVTPTIVVQAAHMVYPHRLVLATVETERTLQWGSDQEAIARMLRGVTVKAVIEDVIASVPAPL